MVYGNNTQFSSLFGHLCKDLKRAVRLGEDVMLWLDDLNSKTSTMGKQWLAAFKICQRIFDVQKIPASVNQYMENLRTWENPFSWWNLEVFLLFRYCVEVWTHMKRINGTCAPKDLSVKEIADFRRTIIDGFEKIRHSQHYNLCEAYVYVCEFIANMYRKKQEIGPAWYCFSELLESAYVVYDLKRRASLLEHFAKMILEIFDRDNVDIPTMFESLKLALQKCAWAGTLMGELNKLDLSACDEYHRTPRRTKALIFLGNSIIKSACDTLEASASNNYYMHFVLCCTRVKLLLLRHRFGSEVGLEERLQEQVSKLKQLRKKVLCNDQGNFVNITQEINVLNKKLRTARLDHLCIENVACSNCFGGIP